MKYLLNFAEFRFRERLQPPPRPAAKVAGACSRTIHGENLWEIHEENGSFYGGIKMTHRIHGAGIYTITVEDQQLEYGKIKVPCLTRVQDISVFICC